MSRNEEYEKRDEPLSIGRHMRSFASRYEENEARNEPVSLRDLWIVFCNDEYGPRDMTFEIFCSRHIIDVRHIAIMALFLRDDVFGDGANRIQMENYARYLGVVGIVHLHEFCKLRCNADDLIFMNKFNRTLVTEWLENDQREFNDVFDFVGTLFGDKVDEPEKLYYSKMLSRAGFRSVAKILRSCESREVESWVWMSNWHRTHFLEWLANHLNNIADIGAFLYLDAIGSCDLEYEDALVYAKELSVFGFPDIRSMLSDCQEYVDVEEWSFMKKYHRNVFKDWLTNCYYPGIPLKYRGYNDRNGDDDNVEVVDRNGDDDDVEVVDRNGDDDNVEVVDMQENEEDEEDIEVIAVIEDR